FLRSINACGMGPNGQGLNPNLKCVSITRASEAGLPQGLRRIYYRNLQPRLSFAYRPFKDSRTVIRGGFGIFTLTNLGQLSFNITDIASSVVRTYTNADPVTGAPRYQFPAPFYAAATQEFIGSSDFYQNTPTNYRDPQSAQWNLTVERELPGDMALRVSYVGMNSYRLNLTVDLNQTPPRSQAYDPSQKPYKNWNRILSSEKLRPDRIGDGSIDSPTPDRYFDINAFTAPPANAGRIGNAGVGILVGPGTVAVSGGLSKTFAV